MNFANEKNYRERVYAIVRQMPLGRVMPYGQIAQILGQGYTPRTVGYVMHGADTDNVPWQRVINSQGKCSTGKMTVPVNLQQTMLEQEGVVFDAKERCDLSKYLWLPEGLDNEDSDEDQPTLFG